MGRRLSYVLVLHLEVFDIPMGEESLLPSAVSLLRIGNYLDDLQGTQVFIKIGLRFELSSIGSSSFNILKISGHS